MTFALRPIRIDPDATDLEVLDLDPADFQSPLPVQHYAPIFEDKAIGLAVGIWDTTTMQEAFGPYPGDECITVLDGHFTMVDEADDPLASAQAGDSVTFRNGVPSSWKQDGYLRKVYLTLQDPTGKAPAMVGAKDGFRVVGPDRVPLGSPDADGVVREVIFRNDAGTMTVALAAFPGLGLPLAPCPAHRLVRVLAGEITLTGTAGPPETFGAGAHVFLPKGTVHAQRATAGTVVLVVDVLAE